jgi:hypothetical protein
MGEHRRMTARPNPHGPFRGTLVGIVLTGLLALVPAAASAKTFEVTKRGDPAPGACTPADCSLREAVVAANARPGNDVIRLAARKPYRLTRSSSDPGAEEDQGDLEAGVAINEVGNAIRIKHPGRGRAVIDAEGADDRAFEVNGQLTLVKITIRGGHANSGGEAGGGIYGAGRVVLKRSLIAGNLAGDVGAGVYMAVGNLVVTRSTIRGNDGGEGGGIFIGTSGVLRMTRSTVAGNDAPNGAGGIGLANGAPGGSVIQTSTLEGNLSGSDGGGIENGSAGLRIVNTTIARNSAEARGGGIHARPGSFLRMNAVTVARNRADSDDSGGPETGGGLYGDGGSDVIEARNSLIALNRILGGVLNECDAPAPVGIESLGGNLISDDVNGCTFFGSDDYVQANPRIGQLAKNGGPTRTIAIRKQSAAVNHADGPNPPKRDQRGVKRKNPDIGAYER